ncbi:hypothetical protein ASD65_04770 [Microbacterium sp. Root61]|uniref:Fpg/Nei family DNA glycosylase n=1 Tax=Microbacterium sp. Root61 TaxID=1736570 RepID=UPI0006F5349D|nr:DNA-formamidopyrimidine glycosylase family protein [Microbacterium sp. Root61]KRA25904.1 hypothetical protein ASD65_04770 [Microbacterium sp. Root61]
MPESPEVQALVDFLSDRIPDRTVTGFDVVLGKALKTRHPEPSDLIGCRVVAVARFGKLIDVVAETLEGGAVHLIVHWGHDGWLLWHDAAPDGLKRAGDATLMARLRFDDGSGFDLTDSGQWKALSIFLVSDPRDAPAIAKLGPDPLAEDVSVAALAGVLGGRRKQLKALLQDQTALAGIGNAYSDEILHAAKLSPVVHAAVLTPAEIERLHSAIEGILQHAVAARRGLPPESLKDEKRGDMQVHRRPGEPCPVCGGTIAEFTFSGAAAHYCPTCQTAGVLLS